MGGGGHPSLLLSSQSPPPPALSDTSIVLRITQEMNRQVVMIIHHTLIQGLI